MPNVAILKNVSFHDPICEKTVDGFKKYLESRVTFIEVKNVKDLLSLVKIEFNAEDEDKLIDVENCLYTPTTLLQGIYTETNNLLIYEKFMFVKRKILDDDTYTYLEIGSEKDLESNRYDFLDVMYDDMVDVMLGFSKTKCVVVCPDGSVHDTETEDIFDKKTSTGVLKYSFNKKETSLKYYNVISSFEAMTNPTNSDDDSDDEIDAVDELKRVEKQVVKQVNECGASHIYSQININIALLNCYCELNSPSRNEIMSKILKQDIFGTVVVGLENHLNNDNRILPLTADTFKKIIKFRDTDKYMPKNKLFCNVFYELEHME